MTKKVRGPFCFFLGESSSWISCRCSGGHYRRPCAALCPRLLCRSSNSIHTTLAFAIHAAFLSRSSWGLISKLAFRIFRLATWKIRVFSWGLTEGLTEKNKKQLFSLFKGTFQGDFSRGLLMWRSLSEVFQDCNQILEALDPRCARAFALRGEAGPQRSAARWSIARETPRAKAQLELRQLNEARWNSMGRWEDGKLGRFDAFQGENME